VILLINFNNEWIVEPQHFKQIIRFSNGLSVAVNQEGKVGVINTKGKYIIEPIYDRAYFVDKELLVVKQEEQFEYALLIKTKGKVVAHLENIDRFS
jgi:hypothetical protein